MCIRDRKNRPEYLSYKSRIDSLKALLKSARSGYFPNIYITGGLTYSGYETDNMVYNWNIGAALNWNLFSGFYTEGYYEEIKAQIRMNEALLNQIVKNLYLEIENAKILFDEAKERVNLAASLMKTAEESLSLAEARYKSGLGTFIEVTDAQNVYVNAKNSLIQAEYDLILSGAKLRKALGILNYNKRGE
ncbi:MAG: TolC family protein, partial [Deltaproteobacteria bacterium]|nr:TolC family protein [Deltaproteobacteria bacterium]